MSEMVNCQLSETGTLSHYPHGRVQPFHQKSTCLMQSTLGPYEVQIWSRNTPESGPNETLVLLLVEASDKSIVEQGTHCEEEAGTLSHYVGESDPRSNRAIQGYLTHKNRALLGPYSRNMHMSLWWVLGGGHFLMIEVPM